MTDSLPAKSKATPRKAIRHPLKPAAIPTKALGVSADNGAQAAAAAQGAQARVDALDAELRRFTALHRCGGHAGAGGTDALMRMLRGDDDGQQAPG